jgi:hypothetical protein
VAHFFLCARKAASVNLELLTPEHMLVGGGISAGLMLVRTFCWCWRRRTDSKWTLAFLDKLREIHLSREPPALWGLVVFPDDPDAT